MSILDSSFAAYTETEPATKITNKVNNKMVLFSLPDLLVI